MKACTDEEFAEKLIKNFKNEPISIVKLVIDSNDKIIAKEKEDIIRSKIGRAHV